MNKQLRKQLLEQLGGQLINHMMEQHRGRIIEQLYWEFIWKLERELND